MKKGKSDCYFLPKERLGGLISRKCIANIISIIRVISNFAKKYFKAPAIIQKH